MKLIKTANNKKLILSEKDWVHVGLAYDWFKSSMAVPIRDEDRINMAKDGIYTVLDIFKRLPSTTIKDMNVVINDLKNTGATEFFKTLDVNTAIRLPAIYIADPNRIIQINEKAYYVLDVIEPKIVGRKSIINGVEYQKGDRYNGEVIAMNAETGLPETLQFDEVKESIRMSPEEKIKTLNAINKEIESWNKRVESIDKAVGVTKLALQATWAEGKINERLNVLENQKKFVQAKIDDPKIISPESYNSWMKFVTEGIKQGKFNLKDTFDALLFLYQSVGPERLIRDIETGEIVVPNEMKDGLITMLNREFQSSQAIKAKETVEQEERQTREEQPLSEEKEPKEIKIQPLTEEDIPSGEYGTIKEYKTLNHWIAALKNMLIGIDKNINQLRDILSGFEGLRQYIGALEKGQRSQEYLRSPEGQNVINTLKEFLDKIELFAKRYKVDTIDDNGKLNAKLMGREGTVGNALLAVALNRIYDIIKQSIGEPIGVSEPVKEIEEPVAAPTPPVNAKSNSITKISEALLDVFKNKMGIKQI